MNISSILYITIKTSTKEYETRESPT
jgi:hypothetical protein